MQSSNNIPFLDLVSPHVELERELTDVFRRVITSAGFIGGQVLEEFEQSFAQFCETKYCVGAANGTDALRFALMATGVRPGDVVITVAHTFIATTEAISQAGALPEFVDIDERTYNMQPERLRNYLETNCTIEAGKLVSRRSGRPVTAVIPVHLYGQMADMDPILELAELYNLTVIEDACQAHGAQYFSKRANAWKKAGSMGRAAAFSFYPGKNLGACGEAGAVTTNDEAVARQIRMIRDHGQSVKYYHDIEGYNGRLDAMQAGFLQVKLAHLAKWNTSRAKIAKRYGDLFSAVDAHVIRPFEPSWSRAVYHLYVIQVQDREKLKKELAEEGIGTGIHYPIPLHLQKAYRNLGVGRGELPVCEAASERILSLPMFPTLSEADQTRVVDAVIRCTHKTPLQRAAATSV